MSFSFQIEFFLFFAFEQFPLAFQHPQFRLNAYGTFKQWRDGSNDGLPANVAPFFKGDFQHPHGDQKLISHFFKFFLRSLIISLFRCYVFGRHCFFSNTYLRILFHSIRGSTSRFYVLNRYCSFNHTNLREFFLLFRDSTSWWRTLVIIGHDGMRNGFHVLHIFGFQTCD